MNWIRRVGAEGQGGPASHGNLCCVLVLTPDLTPPTKPWTPGMSLLSARDRVSQGQTPPRFARWHIVHAQQNVC